MWLRVRGLGFGLPAVYNPDEVAIMSRALAFAKGDLNPHNFLYPTLYFYALFGWIGGLSSSRARLGAVSVGRRVPAVVLPRPDRPSTSRGGR